RFLERAGYGVREARSGEQALELVKTEPVFDLILMDIEMVGLDGFETTREIRKLDGGGDLPIIALTAHASKGFRQLCLEADMDDYLSKPINRRDLLTRVARHLGDQGAGPRRPAPEPVTSAGAPDTDAPAGTALSGPPSGGPVAGGDQSSVLLSVKSEIRDLIPGFLERCRASAAELVAGAGSEEAQRTGHNLKGSGAAYGFPRISTLGSAIEESAKQGENWGHLALELQDYLARVRFE
ncbi:MAG: response regulator, partial [Acidobacteriota bacterium]